MARVLAALAERMAAAVRDGLSALMAADPVPERTAAELLGADGLEGYWFHCVE